MFRLFAAACLVAVAFGSEEKEKETKKEYGTVIGIDLGTTYSW